MSGSPFEAVVVPPGLPLPRQPVAAAWVASVCEALRDAGGALRRRPAAELIGVLGRVGQRFLTAGDALREEALVRLPAAAGISGPMAEVVLDGMASDWTRSRLEGLLDAELGGGDVLDGFEERRGRSTMALGPRLCVQIVAGSVPGVGVSALLRSLLLKSPTLLKPGRGDTVLPVLFARALADADPELATAVAVVYWPGGSEDLEDAALSRAEVVTAYGSDATVAALRARTPVTARFVAYHHRVSIGVVGRDALVESAVHLTAREVARAVALFDRRGCVSPQIVYVEERGEVTPRGFAEALVSELASLEQTLPTGPLQPAEASSLHQARGAAEMAAAESGGAIFHGGASAWTVALEPADQTARLDLPVVGRAVRVQPIESAEELPERVAPLARHLQTVGVAGLGERTRSVARTLAAAGASRVVPFAAVPFPPPWWHHDGGGPLVDLVRWVDLEGA